jgi:putative ABC transport system ATP-binding protein
MEVFKMLNKQGKTIIMVTHDREIGVYAERVVLFRDGKVLEDGEVQRAI